MDLLKELVAIRALSSDESAMKEFLLTYIDTNSSRWKVKPTCIHGEEFQRFSSLVNPF